MTKAYWWTRVPNFGDALAPFLLARFADLDQIELCPIMEADIVSVGSVLEQILPGWRGFILGSGLLRETSKLKFDSAETSILALRGPLTVRSSGLSGDIALGDPGLLANELIEPQEKKWDLGIVPHWQDTNLAERFSQMIPAKWTTKVIDPGGHPLDVIRDIASSRRIVTSSLHGMIVADAIGGIPRRVEACEVMNKDGGLFKFHDYNAAIHCTFEVGKMIEPERNRVEDSRFEIWDAYRELSRAYGKS